MFALVEYDERVERDVIRLLRQNKDGHAKWVDVSNVRDVQIGWMINPDGSVTPYQHSVAKAREIKNKELKDECSLAILAGFKSRALGSEYLYGSNENDQRNLLQDSMQTDGADIWCADSGGIWSRLKHAQSQVAVALSDFHAMRSSAQRRLVDLRKRVDAAESTAEVEAVYW